MKKIKHLIILLTSSMLLLACSGKQEVGICEQTFEETNRLRMEFFAKNDKVYGYKAMFGFNQNLFEGKTEPEIEQIIESDLGMKESPVDAIEVGYEHIDGYSFVSVHFKDLGKITEADFTTMGISDAIENKTSLQELFKTNEAEEGIKCWVKE